MNDKKLSAVLYITPISPSLVGGGNIHCYSNLKALCEYPEIVVDYVGPPIVSNITDFKNLRILHARNYRVLDKLYAAFTMSATSLKGIFIELEKDIGKKYSLCFVEFSKAGFIFNTIGKETKTICCFHNVEADYSRINNRGTSRLATAYIRKSERLSLQLSDHVLVMHKDDLRRLVEIYHVYNNDKYYIHPVCYPNSLVLPLKLSEREKYVLIPGSLSEPFNSQGVITFIEKCWPALYKAGIQLVVAGRNPHEELRKKVKGKDITLIVNPESMTDIVRRARVVVVPDKYGLGMKLRVAEAMSYGVPVVGTKLGLRGYGDDISFGITVDSIEEMADPIKEIICNDDKASYFMLAARKEWENNYSYHQFRNRLHSWIKLWLDNN
ncbi:MAG: glycosyltransferase family 4 protein [Bacteroidales bacterium]|nr:glycosyltransferase family 4 protein [Bacteroidales bacterium]